MTQNIRKRRPRKPGPALPPPTYSKRLLLRLAPSDVGMFRFLLEAYDNLAYFSVLEPKTALLKIVFSPHADNTVHRALQEIAESLPIEIEEYPWSQE